MRTLYSKLAVALTVLVAALLVAQIIVTMRITQAYEEEATQSLYRDLARNLLSQQVDPKWGIPVLEGAFEMLMHLNPLMEIYWLDPEGRLLVYADPDGHVVRDRVDTAPIEAFVAGEAMYPIRGDDPRHPTRRVIFSAAEVREEGALRAYLYVVLQGESIRSIGDMIGGSRIAQLAVGSLALVSVFGLVVGLVLFRSITRRVTELDREMARFLAGSDAGDPALAHGSDELDRLRSTFDHLAARVSQQVNALEEVDRLRRELVASVSHDLRTPLAALRGYLETLQMMGDQLEPAEQRRYLEAASRHTHRLASLVDSLFELAKLESGVVQPRREPFQLEELAQDVAQPYELRAKGAGVELRCDLAAGLPAVYADIGLVERVLENLIENALRHTPSGGRVELRVREAAGEVEASVSDTGSGIPPEALPHIFERFYRAPGDAAGEGMGLGLAIVERILELHGRAVEVTSTPGEGTRFAFRLGRDESGAGTWQASSPLPASSARSLTSRGSGVSRKAAPLSVSSETATTPPIAAPGMKSTGNHAYCASGYALEPSSLLKIVRRVVAAMLVTSASGGSRVPVSSQWVKCTWLLASWSPWRSCGSRSTSSPSAIPRS